jgi:hypothetical protein
VTPALHVDFVNMVELIRIVMAGLDPAIHALFVQAKTWMPGTRPGMTDEGLGSPA